MKNTFWYNWLGLSVGSIILIVSRWVYKSQYLFHWDSVQFALAMGDLDIVHHRPHPPGYIFYVWIARTFRQFVSDDNTALILVGILFSIIGLWLVFYFARYIFKDQLAGWAAAALYLVNISVWFHGLVAEVYIVEAVVALAVIFAIYTAWQKPDLNRLLLAAGLLGILGGFRQTTELVLIPLFLFVLISRRRQVKEWLYSGVVGIAANLVWFVPVVINTGGVGQYWDALTRLARVVFISDYYLRSGAWVKIINNLKLQVHIFTLAVAGEMVVLYLAASPYFMRGGSSKYKIHWPHIWFWVWAILPAILFMGATLVTNAGYMLLVILPVIVLTAGGISSLMHNLRVRWPAPLVNLFVAVVLVALSGYQIYNFYTVKPESFKFISASLVSIQRHDLVLKEIISTINNSGTSDNSAIWIKSDNTIIFFGARHLQYYMPTYDIYRRTPYSLISADEGNIWHMRGPNLDTFEDKATIQSGVEKLFAIRDTWSSLHTSYEIPITLPSGNTIVYYDLTDPATRQYLRDEQYFIFTD